MIFVNLMGQWNIRLSIGGKWNMCLHHFCCPFAYHAHHAPWAQNCNERLCYGLDLECHSLPPKKLMC